MQGRAIFSTIFVCNNQVDRHVTVQPVHAVNHMQESALHFAAECRRSVEIAEVLLAANAAIDAVDRFKASALDRAVDMGCTELVEFLLARNALVTDNHDDGYDPLIFRPVIDNHSEIVAMLLAHSPHLLDARTKGDDTNALHHATDPEIVQQLLSLNPALLVESDRNGVSPFHTAVMNNRDKVVTRMLALSNEQTLEVLRSSPRCGNWTSKQCMWSTRLPSISLCEETSIGRSR